MNTFNCDYCGQFLYIYDLQLIFVTICNSISVSSVSCSLMLLNNEVKLPSMLRHSADLMLLNYTDLHNCYFPNDRSFSFFQKGQILLYSQFTFCMTAFINVVKLWENKKWTFCIIHSTAGCLITELLQSLIDSSCVLSSRTTEAKQPRSSNTQWLVSS